MQLNSAGLQKPFLVALGEIIQYAQRKGLLVVVDGKRNDIGSTATAYAAGYLGRGGQSAWGADALTVNPYLGDDSLKPFVDMAVKRSAGIFVLAVDALKGWVPVLVAMLSNHYSFLYGAPRNAPTVELAYPQL